MATSPGIIKVPFLRMTAQNPRATYACVNLGEAVTMRGLEEQSILFDADIIQGTKSRVNSSFSCYF